MGRPRNKKKIRKYEKSKEKRVPTGKTQRSELEEPSWKAPHLNFGTTKSGFQTGPSGRKVIKREISPRSKVKEKVPQREMSEGLEKIIDKMLEKMLKREALKKPEDIFEERRSKREMPEKTEDKLDNEVKKDDLRD